MPNNLSGARIAELKEDGKDIRENYISAFQALPKKDSFHPSRSVYHPVMVPPMPLAKFVDKIDWKSVNMIKRTKPEVKKYCEALKDNQDGFEAEVKVFTVIQRMKQQEKIIVLHSLEYLHSDYQIFVGDHLYIKGDKKGEPCDRDNDAKEGEADFIIMGKNYFVIMEVKKNKAYLGYGKPQAIRTEKLILGIAKMSGSAIPPVFKVVVAPKPAYNDAKFRRWWKKNITDKDSVEMEGPELFEETKNVLLALRANKDNQWEKKRCSLGWNIRLIDEQLRDAIVTYEKKGVRNVNSNPGVVEAPARIRDFVGIKYLRTEQDKTLKSVAKFLWIDGPAGTGKTVIMCGKILELALSDKKNRILVIASSGQGNNANLYETALNNAGVICETIKVEHNIYHVIEKLMNVVSRSKESHQVVIIKMECVIEKYGLMKLIASQTDSSVFIDDIQRTVLSYTDISRSSVSELIRTLKKLSDEHHVWVACDMVQSFLHVLNFGDLNLDAELASSDVQHVSLSKNLRNTYEISTVLYVLRNLFNAMIRKKFGKVFPKFNQEYGHLFIHGPLINQEYGHLIHGPLITIHVFYRDILFEEVFINEFKTLLKTDDLDYYTDIGILCYTHVHSIVLVENAVDTLRTKGYDTDKITTCWFQDSSSSEWPAVIVVHVLDGLRSGSAGDVSLLYTAISRARVKCSVLLLHPSSVSDGHLLEKLEPIARVIKHY